MEIENRTAKNKERTPNNSNIKGLVKEIRSRKGTWNEWTQALTHHHHHHHHCHHHRHHHRPEMTKPKPREKKGVTGEKKASVRFFQSAVNS